VAVTKRVATLRVSAAEIAGMQAAATIVRDIRSTLIRHDGGILSTFAADLDAFVEWQHYPAGEVYDPQSHAQFFYHTHSAAQRSAREHGHFHTFLRAEGMPLGVAPLVLPEIAIANALRPPPQAAPLKYGGRDEVSHLVAVALNGRGEPIRLFTTNRWVTGETWYRGDDVIKMLNRFTLGAAACPVLLNRWVTSIVALFRPQIASLLRLRDETVMGWRRRRRTNVFEDPRLEITSSFDVDLDTQFALLAQLQANLSPGCPSRSARLPPMAEGWGEGHAS
jgi:Domain of unknown function (DUF6969)